MSKRFNALNGTDFAAMVMAGAERLRSNVNNVNALNVFPVPDGDTGTNMNLTMTSGMEELKRRPNHHIGRAADALSKGLLMGARGNSGVILSQLFRGFAKSVLNFEEITPQQFAAALQQGVDTAYQAVVKPVEGTILTVAREAAKHAQYYARRTNDVAELMNEVLQYGKQALAKTPDQLPVLKQVGVVDAGGQGLICVYEGFVAALTGEAVEAAPVALEQMDLAHDAHSIVRKEARTAQSLLSTEDIEQGYCTEFIIKLVPGKVQGIEFRETDFRRELTEMGDSLLVVSDDDLVKVHIHAEAPGSVMNYAMKYGELTRIKIENMREQHTHILETDQYDQNYSAPSAGQEAGQAIHGEKQEANETGVEAELVEEGTDAAAPNAFVAVAMGSGITDIFHSLGVDEVISGGQTMNPSTEDLVKAIRNTNAETVFILPNNSNIIMAAKQAQELVEDRKVIVIPSKTVPQGMSALIAYQDSADAEVNEEAMLQAVRQVRSGQVTKAVRDTSIDGLTILEGDFIGILDGTIVVSRSDLLEACQGLLDAMMSDGGEIVTILTGEEAMTEDTERLSAYAQQQFPEAELEVHAGGQPLYPYIIAVE